MRARTTLRWYERAFVKFFDAMSKLAFGYSVPFSSEMVLSLGFGGIMQFGMMIPKVIGHMTKQYGPRDAQALVGFSALWSGCTFCSVGYLYSSNLVHFRDTGKLPAIDEKLLISLQREKDSDVIARVDLLLAAPEYARLRGLVERQLALKSGTAEGATPDDDLLRASLVAWEWVSECSIVAENVEIPPLTPIAKDHKLRERYLEARRSLATPPTGQLSAT